MSLADDLRPVLVAVAGEPIRRKVTIEGAARFNEFREALGRVPPATLTARLTELVEAGVLERRVLDTRPPAVEYRLTRRGRQFEPLLRELVRCRLR